MGKLDLSQHTIGRVFEYLEQVVTRSLRLALQLPRDAIISHGIAVTIAPGVVPRTSKPLNYGAREEALNLLRAREKYTLIALNFSSLLYLYQSIPGLLIIFLPPLDDALMAGFYEFVRVVIAFDVFMFTCLRNPSVIQYLKE